jgi:hypothetical protein
VGSSLRVAGALGGPGPAFVAAEAVTMYVTPAVKLVSSREGVAAFTVTFVKILLEALLLSPPPRTTTCWNRIWFTIRRLKDKHKHIFIIFMYIIEKLYYASVYILLSFKRNASFSVFMA